MMEKLILVVEDDESLKEVIGMILREAGYQVMAARDGAEALAEVQRLSPALILIDLNLRDMDSVHLAATMRRQQPALQAPILLMTGDHMRADTVRGPRAVEPSGALRSIARPFALNALLDTVRVHLGLPMCLPRRPG